MLMLDNLSLITALNSLHVMKTNVLHYIEICMIAFFLILFILNLIMRKTGQHYLG